MSGWKYPERRPLPQPILQEGALLHLANNDFAVAGAVGIGHAWCVEGKANLAMRIEQNTAAQPTNTRGQALDREVCGLHGGMASPDQVGGSFSQEHLDDRLAPTGG